MSAAIHQTDSKKEDTKRETDVKNLEEIVKQINKIVSENQQKQAELNEISSIYIRTQGEINVNHKNIAELFALKNKLETDILKAKIAMLEGSVKSSTDEKK
jgi:methyl coenzyme M reductase subunit C-like uncharacterized protein (methanogenesis marker protein 7)